MVFLILPEPMKNPNITYICVYCSSSDGVENKYKSLARNLGRILGQTGYNLIFGGCKVGLMGEVARGVHKSGKKVIGVIPQRIFDREIQYEACNEMIVTDSMNKRKQIMINKSDGFIILPGGFGTLEELFEILTLKQLGYETKPIVIINKYGYYNELFGFFEKIYNEKFAKRTFQNIFKIVENIAEAMDYLLNYEEKEIPSKWFGTN